MSTTPQVPVDSRVMASAANATFPDTFVVKDGTPVTGDATKIKLGPNQQNVYDGIDIDLMQRVGGRLSTSVGIGGAASTLLYVLAPGEVSELRVSGWVKSTGDDVVQVEAVWKLQNASSSLIQTLKSKTIDPGTSGLAVDVSISVSGDLNIFLAMSGDASDATTWRLEVGFSTTNEDFS